MSLVPLKEHGADSLRRWRVAARGKMQPTDSKQNCCNNRRKQLIFRAEQAKPAWVGIGRNRSIRIGPFTFFCPGSMDSPKADKLESSNIGVGENAKMRFSLSVLLFSSFWCSSIQAQDQWQEQCQQPSEDHDSVFEFDGHPLVVGGRPHKRGVLYCVVVQGAKQDYLVNWPEAQMNGVVTRNGVLAHSIRIALPITIARTTLEIGANAKRFQVEVPVNGNRLKPLEQISEGQAWDATTKLFGALPLSDSSGKFRAVDLEINTARTADGVCHMSYIDYANSDEKQYHFFKLPSELVAQVSAVDLKGYRAFDNHYDEFSYKLSNGLAQPTFASLAIVNDDGKELATIPFVGCGGEALK